MTSSTKYKIINRLYFEFVNLKSNKGFSIGEITDKFYRKYPEFK